MKQTFYFYTYTLLEVPTRLLLLFSEVHVVIAIHSLLNGGNTSSYAYTLTRIAKFNVQDFLSVFAAPHPPPCPTPHSTPPTVLYKFFNVIH